MFFDPEVQQNVADPGYIVVGFGWTHSSLMHCGPRIMEGLLRAKADSLLAMFPNCPILTALGTTALRLVGEGRRYYNGNGGEKTWRENELIGDEGWRKRINPAIPMGSRLCMESIFGVTVAYQLYIENYLNSLERLGDMDTTVFECLIKSVWSDYYFRNEYHFAAFETNLFPT